MQSLKSIGQMRPVFTNMVWFFIYIFLNMDNQSQVQQSMEWNYFSFSNFSGVFEPTVGFKRVLLGRAVSQKPFNFVLDISMLSLFLKIKRMIWSFWLLYTHIKFVRGRRSLRNILGMRVHPAISRNRGPHYPESNHFSSGASFTDRHGEVITSM